jgi:hypothetical protein
LLGKAACFYASTPDFSESAPNPANPLLIGLRTLAKHLSCNTFYPRTLIDMQQLQTEMKCSSCCTAFRVDAADSRYKPMSNYLVPPPRHECRSRVQLPFFVNLAERSISQGFLKPPRVLPSRKPFPPYMLQGGSLKQRKTGSQCHERVTLTHSHRCSFACLLCYQLGTYRRH